jgi:hypothetical protein
VPVWVQLVSLGRGKYAEPSAATTRRRPTSTTPDPWQVARRRIVRPAQRSVDRSPSTARRCPLHGWPSPHDPVRCGGLVGNPARTSAGAWARRSGITTGDPIWQRHRMSLSPGFERCGQPHRPPLGARCHGAARRHRMAHPVPLTECDHTARDTSACGALAWCTAHVSGGRSLFLASALIDGRGLRRSRECPAGCHRTGGTARRYPAAPRESKQRPAWCVEWWTSIR